jgi:hypothetical protein
VYFANHRSHGDFVLIWASLPPALRRRTRPVAGADYWLTSPLRRFLINRVFHGVTIDRRPDRQGPNPVEQMGAALVAGDSLILFPRAPATWARACCPSRAASTTSPAPTRRPSSSRSGSRTSAG